MENTQPLILSLLKAELRNTRLIKGLDSAGLTADDFYLGISTQILKLIGFPYAEEDDELHDLYYALLESKCKMELEKFMEKQNLLTLELYNELLLERVRRQEVLVSKEIMT